MSTPRYFHFYDMPDFNARFGEDQALTTRCESVSVPIFRALAQEVRFLRQVPGDCLSTSLWDLCYCAGVLIDSIPFDGWTVEASCTHEAPQLFKIAKRFLEHNIVGSALRQKFETLIAYVERGVGIEELEAVS